MFNFRWIIKLFEALSQTKPPEIKDVRQEFPWHETRKWSKRATSQIKQIIIHQAISVGSAKAINNYHITPSPQNHLSLKGAPHIAYHYAIDRDGKVLWCNSHTDVTWHCRGENTRSIGVIVCGDFDYEGHVGADSKPTRLQMKNLKALLRTLKTQLELTDMNIYGHNEFGKTSCPGTHIQDFINERKLV